MAVCYLLFIGMWTVALAVAYCSLAGVSPPSPVNLLGGSSTVWETAGQAVQFHLPGQELTLGFENAGSRAFKTVQEVSDLCNMILGKKLRPGASPELRACGSIQKLREQLESSEDSDLSSFGPKVQRCSLCLCGNGAHACSMLAGWYSAR